MNHTSVLLAIAILIPLLLPGQTDIENPTGCNCQNYRSAKHEDSIPSLRKVADFHEKDAGYLIFEVEIILKYLTKQGYIENVQDVLQAKNGPAVTEKCWNDKIIEIMRVDTIQLEKFNKLSEQEQKDSLKILRSKITMHNLNQFSRFIYCLTDCPVKNRQGGCVFIETGPRGKIQWETVYVRELNVRKDFLRNGFLQLTARYLGLVPPMDKPKEEKIKWIRHHFTTGDIPDHKELSSQK